MTTDHARRWCLETARTAPKHEIARAGAPYLTRYFVAGWNPETRHPGPAVFLHHFVASDPVDEVHSHPWGWSLSVILVGGYREIRCDHVGQVHVREYRPGETNVLQPDDRHRIELLTDECWTLFLAGDFARPWRFFPTCEGGRSAVDDLLVF